MSLLMVFLQLLPNLPLPFFLPSLQTFLLHLHTCPPLPFLLSSLLTIFLHHLPFNCLLSHLPCPPLPFLLFRIAYYLPSPSSLQLSSFTFFLALFIHSSLPHYLLTSSFTIFLALLFHSFFPNCLYLPSPPS